MMRHSAASLVALNVAASEAIGGGHAQIEPGHLMIALCKLPELHMEDLIAEAPPEIASAGRDVEREIRCVRDSFLTAGVDPKHLRRRLRAKLARGGLAPAREIHRSPESRTVCTRAEELAKEERRDAVELPHLLQALLEDGAAVWVDVLVDMGVDQERLADAVVAWTSAQDSGPPGATLTLQPNVKEKAQPRPRPKERSKTPLLDKFGRDLTQQASEGRIDPVIGRKDEMRRLAQVLLQKKKNSSILVGDAGVGKTCVVEGLALRVVDRQAPDKLRGKRIVQLDMAAVVAGTKYRGEFEERLQGIMKEAASSRDIVLFIDEIHTLVGAGGAGEGSMDAANILKPALARGEIQCIGATTTPEYRKYIEKDPALERRFELIWVDEPTREESVAILTGIRARLEEHHGVEISDDAIDAAVEMTLRHLPDLRLPDKAISIIDQACAQARLKSLSFGSRDTEEKQKLGREHVAKAVALRARVPLADLTTPEAERLLRLEEFIHRRVMGQDDAVKEVCEVIRTARSGLKDPRRPVGTFFFLGPTGTGKTELAKTLAQVLFGDENRLLRFDMSEFAEKHSVAKLIGSPPGYIGHDEEGQLTGKVRTNPYSVVLFDEIEKAHPDVFDIFLQILDDGRLTDSKGRRAVFSEAIILFTSNLGCRPAGKGPKRIGVEAASGGAPASTYERMRESAMQAVKQTLRPEFVNRIGRFVVFRPLTRVAARAIAAKILGGIRQRLLEKRIELAEVTSPVFDRLLDEGFSEEYGAREMERVVDRLISQPLGRALIEGRCKEGGRLTIDLKDGEIVFTD